MVLVLLELAPAPMLCEAAWATRVLMVGVVKPHCVHVYSGVAATEVLMEGGAVMAVAIGSWVVAAVVVVVVVGMCFAR